ncbi:hypothetical protein XA68_17388 [Ophiocordyceps unilateralis]|uniref:Pre-mRNA-splicing factor 38B n=1 Tax=Ophiocordyceps unilateralis TaxID=268505 RepID=A0A2A9P4Y6_OPHUN|nr:hypothetical protein XA68_17388 [Ophiocordyceps unilateralis]
MSHDEILTDDYVASLLAEEAKDCSLKYSAMGMEAFQDSKKPANMPRPNTRFLRHIIKNTDSHNKALLAKETAESRARLEDLDRSNEALRLRRNPDARDIRRRQMGDIRAILGGEKRTGHVSKDGHSSRAPRCRDGDERRYGDGGATKCDSESKHDRDVRHRQGRSDRHDIERRDRRSAGKDRRRSKRAGSYFDSADEEEDRRRGRSRRSRSTSPLQPRRSRSPEKHRLTRHMRQRSHRRHPSADPPARPQSAVGGKHEPNEVNNDSDPLEELIGPAPPTRCRGRGDWDDAAERFRDRQKLRLSQTQRMRAAGFTDEQLRKMQDGAQKTEREVVWSKAGEQRAWDQGKDADTEMDYAPEVVCSHDEVELSSFKDRSATRVKRPWSRARAQSVDLMLSRPANWTELEAHLGRETNDLRAGRPLSSDEAESARRERTGDVLL